jgi:hypothetical protein
LEHGGKKKAFTCQNPSCKKTFTAPLKTLNLQQTAPEPYFTCPHCLTKIETIDGSLKADEKAQLKVNQVESKEKLDNNDNAAACNYHPGYLSERTQKEQIPDDCLVCKDIVDCMLRKMRP